MRKMLKFKEKRGKEIDNKIINLLKNQKTPISTREISLKIGVSWHTIDRHCLKLQLSKNVDGFRISNINTWVLKR